LNIKTWFLTRREEGVQWGTGFTSKPKRVKKSPLFNHIDRKRKGKKKGISSRAKKENNRITYERTSQILNGPRGKE